jgi:hypothetical protein
MTRLKRIAIITLSVLIALTIISCNLVPSFITNLIATPTSTSTPTPTASATATAKPPSPLGLAGCPDPRDCPYAEPMLSFFDGNIEPGSQAYIQFPYNVPVRVGLGWTALDQQHLDENLQHMKFFMTIDDVPYDDPSMFLEGFALDDNQNLTDQPGYFMGFVLTGWQIGIYHKIEYGYTIDAAINDGWEDYQPQTVTYSILAMPLQAATATPQPTATWTPKPVIYTPGPTAQPVVPTAACDSTSSIHILNSTGDTVNMFLTGPASYHFYLTTGDNYLTVCDGGYSYTGYGCGGAYLNGEIHSGDETEFYCY